MGTYRFTDADIAVIIGALDVAARTYKADADSFEDDIHHPGGARLAEQFTRQGNQCNNLRDAMEGHEFAGERFERITECDGCAKEFDELTQRADLPGVNGRAPWFCDKCNPTVDQLRPSPKVAFTFVDYAGEMMECGADYPAGLGEQIATYIEGTVGADSQQPAGAIFFHLDGVGVTVYERHCMSADAQSFGRQQQNFEVEEGAG